MDKDKLLNDQREMILFLEKKLLKTEQKKHEWRDRFVEALKEVDRWRLIISAVIAQSKGHRIEIRKNSFEKLKDMDNMTVVQDDTPGKSIVFKFREKYVVPEELQ